VAGIGKNRKAQRVLVGKYEGRRPLGKPRHRREDTIKPYLKETGWSGVECVDLHLDRVSWWAIVSTEINLRVPSNASNLMCSMPVRCIMRNNEHQLMH
jgi:hypothetical protein